MDAEHKKEHKILLPLLIVFVVAGALFYFLFIKKPEEQIPETGGMSEQELLNQKQLQEIDQIRQKEAGQPISQETPDKQTEELDILRQENQENHSQPLSQEEINKQLEELEKLRSQ